MGRTPLKIGEYVIAEIEGKTIPDAIVIPSSTIYQDTYVYIVSDGVLKRRDVDVLWKSKSEALIGSGLANGDRLVATTLGQVASGTRVSIEGEATSKRGGRGDSKREMSKNSEHRRAKKNDQNTPMTKPSAKEN